MAVDVLHLQTLAANIARDLSSLASTTTSKPDDGVLGRALVDLEVLVGTLRDNPSLWHGANLSTLEKLEQSYGRALGRLIATLGGMPVGSRSRNATLARLIDEDDGVRAALLRLDAAESAEVLEALFELFVPKQARQAQTRGAQQEPPPRLKTNPGPRGSDADQAAEHAAILVAARAASIIPSLLPREPPEVSVRLADPEEAPEQHVDGIKRVQRSARPRKR